MMISPLKERHFWIPFVLSGILFSAFFAWELGAFGNALPLLPRPDPTQLEIVFTVIMVFLLTLNSGLVFWRLNQGACPVGAKRATAISGTLGVLALLCPVCLIIPISLLGLTLSLAFLAPFIPLLWIIVLVLLVTSTKMLWPKKQNTKV